MNKIKLTVNGQKQDLKANDPAHPMLELKQTILVSGATRGDSKTELLELDKDDLVELVFDDDTRWLCPPDSLEDIYPGSLTRKRDGDAVFEVPTELEHPEISRSVLGSITLKVLNLFGKKKINEVVGDEFLKFAHDLEEKQMGKLPGLTRLNGNFALEKLLTINTGNPILLFIHGTNSTTAGSFGELVGTDLWDFITRTYGDNVLSFQHATLTQSPLQNAVDLVKQLPANAVLHVITHSRGGLIGEILCRFSGSSGSEMGFSNQEMKLLEEEGRTADLEAIRALQQLYPQKKFIVKKFIRVACPTGGTTILSKRLDYFFNISLNLLGGIPGFAMNPIYTTMKSLLISIVDQKNNVNVLPGLEAMKPDSPFINIINNQSSTISIGEPVVAISGNSTMKLNMRALFIIASKLFFFEDNDLVVNTKSMYSGSKRRNNLQFFFDEGTEVDHFHYFKNKKTNEAIKLALQFTGTGMIDGFAEFSRGTLGEAERNAILGLDGGQFSTGEPSGEKPIAIILPGIMGSNLAVEDDMVWINYLRFLSGKLINLSIDGAGIKAVSLIKTSYKKLGESLQGDYDVVVFPFDWRLSLEESAAEFDKKINEYLKYRKPIKIIGHSMGGVLVRDFMAYHPATWKALNASEGFRLLFLGSPLGGSFRINNVIFGEDDIISKISKVDIVHTKKRLLKMFSHFPGLLCLLPTNKDEGNNFADGDLWRKMKAAFGDNDWPIPTDGELNDFGKYRDKVTGSKDVDFTNAVYIAGQDKATPCGYRIDETVRGKELVFLSTAEGDQSVTWDSGIPKQMIENGTVYYTNHSHGALSNAPDIFPAIKEILAKGQTIMLTKNRPVVRGDQKVFKRPETPDFDLSPEGLERTLMGISGSEETIPSNQLPLKVMVSHGDLKYASYPVLTGHFKNDSVLYAEQRIDGLLSKLLSEQNKLGIYPGEIGTYEIFFTHSKDNFPGSIVVGLGEPDSLTASELTKTIEQAVTKYLIKANGNERISHELYYKQPLGISSIIIGCGYGGLSVESSIGAILQGIVNANAKVNITYEEKKEKAMLVEHVEFIELYEDKALKGIYSVRRLCKEFKGTLNVTQQGKGLNSLNGGRKQMNLDETSEWWNRINITKDKDAKGETRGMCFSISTGAAREDLRTIFTSTGVVEELVEDISTDHDWTPAKARAVFELLIPNDFKNRLKKHGRIIWILDSYTAEFPWELLQDNGKGAKPLCINAGMIRQLKSENSRVNIELVTDATALVIGDPDLKGAFTQLPGALEEAKTVATLLESKGFETTSLLRQSAGAIVPALVSSNYKIMHLAGHGIFNADPDKPSGMVIGKNSFLTTAEIKQMSTTPELVFVNCCYLGKTDGVAEALFQSRYKLAANIGTQLIDNGVKAVVVAGWAVDDAAALMFARVFYEEMFDGKDFGEAIMQARKAVYNNFPKKNTWGAYQCYGDPFYKLRERKWGKSQKNYVIPAQAEIDLSNLLSDLNTGEPKAEAVIEKLTAICNEVDRQEIRTPGITEKEAMVYVALNDYENAIGKFEEMLLCEDASYSISAMEQYCSIRVKYLGSFVDTDKPKGKGTPAKRLTDAQLKAMFEKVVKDIDSLLQLGQSAERYRLKGSAMKRKLGLINNKELPAAIEKAAKNYYEAFNASRVEIGAGDYANWLALENILVLAKAKKWGQKDTGEEVPGLLPSPETIKAKLKELKAVQSKNASSEKYWERILLPNIDMCLWMLSATFDPKADKMPDTTKLVDSYLRIWNMLGTKKEKESEIENLDILVNLVNRLAPKHFFKEALQSFRDKLIKEISG